MQVGMKAGNCYGLDGQLLKIGTVPNFDSLHASFNGDMSQTILYSEWIEINQSTDIGSFELLWTGPDAEGVFDIEGTIVGPPNSLGVDFNDLCGSGNKGNPDGTTYIGDLQADDLTIENLGHTLVNIADIGISRVRVTYTKTSGSGILNIRYKAVSG